MTVKEAAIRSGLSLDRVYQFCRDRSIDPRMITEDQYLILVARMNKRKEKSIDN
jgi:hypothetical protein